MEARAAGAYSGEPPLAMQLFATELGTVASLASIDDAASLCASVGISVEGGHEQLSVGTMQMLLREHYDAAARRIEADADTAAKD